MFTALLEDPSVLPVPGQLTTTPILVGCMPSSGV